MNGTPENVQLGACEVFIDGVSVGFTIGGAEGIYGPEFHTVKVDQLTGAIDQRLIGEKWGAKCDLAEATLNNLKLAMEFGTKTGSKLTIGTTPAKTSRSRAHSVRLHPIDMGSDKNFDWIIYKAISTAEVNLAYKNDGERVVSVMFEGMVDSTKSDGNYLGMIGDSTV